jgi:hypothetical protein
MRWILRLLFAGLFFPILLLFLLKNHLEDLSDQYNVSDYVHASLQNTFHHGTLDYHAPFDGKVGDKVIIMAKLEKEDTEWVAENLPECVFFSTTSFPHAVHKVSNVCRSWQRAIYTVNPTSHTLLATPMNKGHESMAYLSFVIDRYDNLPATLVFLHSHRAGFLTAWHTDTPLHDNVDALRTLKLSYVQANGYVNLRCNWNPGCEQAHRINKHITSEVWHDVFAGTSTFRPSISNTSAPQDMQMKAPSQVGAACCAQFAVSRDRVRQRPLSDYEQFRQWIIDTEKNDAQSGRVMEFLWHVIFGMDPV